MSKKYMILSVLAIAFLNPETLFAKKRKQGCCGNKDSSEQVQKQESASRRYKAEEAIVEKVPFKTKAKDWAKKTWGNIKSLFKKAKKQILSDINQLF